MSSEGAPKMLEFNPELLQEARTIVSNAPKSLPAEIPGFPGIFVAEAGDSSVHTMTGFLSEEGESYKIGTRSNK